jgi:hypothetical protein
MAEKPTAEDSTAEEPTAEKARQPHLVSMGKWYSREEEALSLPLPGGAKNL